MALNKNQEYHFYRDIEVRPYSENADDIDVVHSNRFVTCDWCGEEYHTTCDNSVCPACGQYEEPEKI